MWFGTTNRSQTIAAQVTGLLFPSNGTAGSDIQLLWNGSNLLPRTGHTAIWKAKYVQQTGYYAVTWHSSNDGTFHSDTYEFGAHPYPSDTGAVNGSGASTAGTSSAGTIHYYEVAGLSGIDFLASPGGTTTLVVKGSFVTQARTCEVIGGTTLRHIFYPDLSNPSVFIQQDISLASLATPTSPAFYFGSSLWRANIPSAGQTDESPSCTLRHLLLYNTALSLANIQAKAALTADDTTDANRWYSNLNPTPSDITDKSGAGHTPSWSNANRPTLFTGP